MSYLLGPIEISQSDSGSNVIKYGTFVAPDSGNYILYQKQYYTGSQFYATVYITWSSNSNYGGTYIGEVRPLAFYIGQWGGSVYNSVVGGQGGVPNINETDMQAGLFKIHLSGSGDSPRTYNYKINIINSLLIP